MKTKIIAIVVSVVIVAGTATGVGVVVKQANDKNAEELVSAAVSEVMATAESTTEETTTEPTTETTSETTTLRDAKLPARTTTTTSTSHTTTTTQKSVPHKLEKGEDKRIIRNFEQYKRAIIDGEITMVSIIEGNCSDAGRYCYFDKNNNLVYIDDISKIDFLDE